MNAGMGPTVIGGPRFGARGYRRVGGMGMGYPMGGMGGMGMGGMGYGGGMGMGGMGMGVWVWEGVWEVWVWEEVWEVWVVIADSVSLCKFWFLPCV